MEGGKSKVNTHETELDAALAGTFSVTLRQGKDKTGGVREEAPFVWRCGS